MGSILGIGVSALNAAQIGLSTTEHNISNVNTPNFHRQQIVQGSAIPQFTGSGFLGQGTQINTVKRIYSQFLDTQVLQAQTQASYFDSYNQQITQIDNLLADPNAGLSPALQDFYQAVNDMVANPASVPSRQTMLSGAQTLAARFQSIDQRLTEIADGVSSQIRSSVTEINSFAKQIGDINQSIALAQSASSGQQPPNDLLDQRDQLVAELNKLIRVSVVTQNDGSTNVFIGNGQALVVGTNVSTLSTVPSSADPSLLTVAYQANSGATIPIASSSLTGGSLGGLLAFQGTSLNDAKNALGRVAMGLAQTFNDQHQLGQDLDGVLGGNFFNVASPQTTANRSNNTGTNAQLTATISNVGVVTTSDYSLLFNGTNYTLTRLSDNTVTTLAGFPGTPATVDGVTFTLASGSFTTGDSFLIQPTRNGARDISVAIADTAKIAVAAPIRANSASANTGSGIISAGSVNLPPPPNANLQQPVTITFTSATTFNVAGTGAGLPATGVGYTSGGAISYNGWSVSITGNPATGDSFSVGPNTNGVSDNRNGLLLAGLQTQNTLAGNTTTYQGAYSQLVGNVGNKAREIDVNGKAQQALVSYTQQTQQSLSGVNLDEEAANLLRYQQAYQAAGKMIGISTTLFQTLLGLFP